MPSVVFSGWMECSVINFVCFVQQEAEKGGTPEEKEHTNGHMQESSEKLPVTYSLWSNIVKSQNSTLFNITWTYKSARTLISYTYGGQLTESGTPRQVYRVRFWWKFSMVMYSCFYITDGGKNNVNYSCVTHVRLVAISHGTRPICGIKFSVKSTINVPTRDIPFWRPQW